MIIATAGHVDHGKTSLVRQLTGVNTDRLEEERRRGMSIELGFAYRETDAGHSVGFIDVPGHRRFINAMISGIRGVDLGMLVVDANDGVMPQTREHVQVMELLGVRERIAVITKIDRAATARVAAVRDEVLRLQPGCEVFPVSNATGVGIAALRAGLDSRAAALRTRAAGGYFRLSVDRAFVLKGAGLIVTGTATAGRVAVGDTLRLLTAKSPMAGTKVRVRGIHAQDRPSPTGCAGQRCALNLVGDVAREDIQRGDVLSDPRCVAPGLRFDARLRLLADAPFALKHLQPVKLHLGARRLQARAYFLDDTVAGHGGAVEGDTRLVQFILKEPLQVCWGDRFLIQDDSESAILGGGTVLAPNAPQWRKRQDSRLRYLRAMTLDDPAAILRRLLVEERQVVDFRDFALSFNLQAAEAEALLGSPGLAGIVRVQADTGDWLLETRRWDTLREALQRAVEAWHSSRPMETGIPQETLLLRRDASVPAPLLAAVLDGLIREKRLLRTGGLIKCATHRPAVSPLIQDAWQRLRAFLAQGGFRIPLLSEIERELKLGQKVQATVIATALQAGNLRRISPKRVALPDVLLGLAAEINRLAVRQDSFSVIEAKTHLDLGRDLTIEILEYFDSIHFTQRQGNGRRVRDAALPQRILT
ncbi:selenocysteine-specific translation elongation factor [Denitratisoma sp. DHT3]|uniref:selenocysteine-specific translation elongation factor n=1 Tax=Denitratisoma sp. DHT3 TaxID=1981880 RepID=UPI0011985B28|nr:selenocysteine-specific translation elongation factor [Denitratisoma sp. DHT3]QDX80616.1 selenocysteine-specific translation elongation factor [Denitratisoma sp. DHT3]